MFQNNWGQTMIPFLLLCLLANEEEKAERDELIVKKLEEIRLDAEKREQNRIAREIEAENVRQFIDWERDNREIEILNRKIAAENRRNALEWERESREIEDENKKNILEYERENREIEARNRKNILEWEKQNRLSG